jgi:predicted dehydrogenase
MDKALVIGLGMGQQYASWLKSLNYNVYTVDVDPNKAADYADVASALRDHQHIDIVYIGTPNWTHESIAREVAPNSKLVVVEKPGVGYSNTWNQLVTAFPDTRFMMVRNNQFRIEMSGFEKLAKHSKQVTICWSRQDGIPGAPWFVDKAKAFGGVSRDLMPHLLSIYTALTNYKNGNKLYAHAEDKNNIGIDDFCEIEFSNNAKWILTTSWKNNNKNEFYIEFDLGIEVVRFELGDYMTAFGGCPAGPYISMLKNAMENLNNNEYWQEQLEQDLWIHKQIENL